MRARVAATGLAVAIVVLLAGNITALVVHDGGGPAAGRADVDIENGHEASELEAALPELIAFVEEARGLKFKRAPKVKLLPDDEFEALFLEEDGGVSAEEEEEEATAFVGFLRALGLVEGEIDLDAVSVDVAASILGFYDPEKRTLYARGTAPTPYVKQVLVHELTHALDDQYFDLDREVITGDDELAFSALVEGSAMAVEQKWYDSRTPEEQAAIDEELEATTSGSGDDDLPDIFAELFSFPYVVGHRFVEAILKDGGLARLDRAFETPPESSEQVINASKFLAGEGPRDVNAPPSPRETFDEGSLGEFGLTVVLDSAVGRGPARQAALGWGGDSYVAWRDGARTCVRWRIVMDTPNDSRELVAAFRTWGAQNPTAQITGTDPLEVTSCR